MWILTVLLISPSISNVNSICILTRAHSLFIYKTNLSDNCVHEPYGGGFSDLKFKLAAVGHIEMLGIFFAQR